MERPFSDQQELFLAPLEGLAPGTALTTPAVESADMPITAGPQVEPLDNAAHALDADLMNEDPLPVAPPIPIRGRRRSQPVPVMNGSIGEAVSQGIAEGASRAMAELGQEIGLLMTDLIDAMRGEIASAIDANIIELPAEEMDAPQSRKCEEPGCEDPTLARNLCRRHYARTLYQERKARQDASGTAPIRRRPRYTSVGERAVIEKKVLAVAPIIRRKKLDAAVPVETAPAVAVVENVAPVTAPPVLQPVPPAGKPPPDLLMENVARFLYRDKA